MIIRLPILSTLALVCAASCTSHPTSHSNPASIVVLNAPIVGSTTSYESRALALTNQERRRHGLRPVRFNANLQHAAQRHSRAMSKHRYVGHQEPGLGDGILKRLKKSGYKAQYGCENVFGPDTSRTVIDHAILTPEDAVRAWMESPGHRRNLLNPKVTEIGLAHENGFWTQILAKPFTPAPWPPPANEGNLVKQPKLPIPGMWGLYRKVD